ncbi:hypothetical protein BDZ91DRAFT_850796 [Kalaharituber pfeilii]|nr:hypothetical protein BDZ91DRAFT_850796 [Kalaharituber pfeilii]
MATVLVVSPMAASYWVLAYGGVGGNGGVKLKKSSEFHPGGKPVNRGWRVWVKAHIGITGNEKADEQAKKGTAKKGREVVTGSGVCQRIKAWRKERREVEGYGKGRVMEWNRIAVSNFTALCLERGSCAVWLKRIGAAESDKCRHGEVQTGEHLAFRCRNQKNRPEGFERWGDMEKNWKRKVENGEEYDILENFFSRVKFWKVGELGSSSM